MKAISILKGYIKTYSFLAQQLVIRDFKIKYKRSFLGVVWSLLNPLLTTAVQFFVFSALFTSSTRNYPMYLVSGVICFNYFVDATNQCLDSITMNGNLLKKVYLPKYIFPLTKTISAAINLTISLIPLLLIAIISGVPLYWTWFLGIYFFLCLIIVSFGAGLILATVMVFFRDTKFIWSLATQILSYATPIFYPAEIIPQQFRWVVAINPLYHIVGSVRKCLMYGMLPTLDDYLVCGLSALAVMFFGLFIFKKNQDKFVLYL